jgi:hypothetical protein
VELLWGFEALGMGGLSTVQCVRHCLLTLEMMLRFLANLPAGHDVPYTGDVRSAPSLWLRVSDDSRSCMIHLPAPDSLLGSVVQTPGGARRLSYHSSSCVGEFLWGGDTDSWSAIPQPHDFNYTV